MTTRKNAVADWLKREHELASELTGMGRMDVKRVVKAITYHRSLHGYLFMIYGAESSR